MSKTMMKPAPVTTQKQQEHPEHPEPPADLVRLARAGRPEETRILADWFQDHGRDADSRLLRILAFEFETATVQARQVRLALDNHGSHEPPDELPFLCVRNIRISLGEFGIPSEVFPISMGSGKSFIVFCPTDGEAEEQTKAKLIRLLKIEYPEVKSWVVLMKNSTMTYAGDEALKLLDAM